MPLMDEKPDVASVTVHSVASPSQESYSERSDEVTAPIGLQSRDHKSSSLLRWLEIIFDWSYILVPLALICKIILCIVAFQRDQTNHANGLYIGAASSITIYLIKFNNQLTTLFTIIFAMIFSALVTRLALWRAQHGASVAELEQWQASKSLPDALKAMWCLRSFTSTSLGLILAWSWLYLGSQASTKEYTLQDSESARKITVTATNVGASSAFDDGYYQNWTNSQKAVCNAQFTTVIGQNQANAAKGYDQNNFMLIPYLYQNTGQKVDRHNYTELPKSVLDTLYTSYVGLQTYALFADLNSTVRGFGSTLWSGQVVGDLYVETAYLNTTCLSLQARNTSEFPSGVMDTMAVSINVTSGASVGVSSSSDQPDPFTFDLWFRTNNKSLAIQAVSQTCQLTSIPVQIKGSCTSIGCIAKKIRRSPNASAASSRTVFDDPVFAQRFFNELLLSTGTPSDPSDLTALELQLWWANAIWSPLYDPVPPDMDLLIQSLPENINAYAANINMSVSNATASIQQYNADVAGFRATQLINPVINSFLMIYQQQQTARSLGLNDVDGPSQLGFFNGSVPTKFLSKGSLKGNYYWPQYTLSVAWIVVDFISCSVLLVAGAFTIYLRSRLVVPEVFGFVSSMTIYNPHVTQPDKSLRLDGLERAKMLKKVKVQFTDLEKSRAQPGHFSLVQVDYPGLGPVQRIGKPRQNISSWKPRFFRRKETTSEN